jgi:hypothetical protein
LRISCPTLPGVFDAPMTAMDFGLKKLFNIL